MAHAPDPIVFGEVLFDHFPDGSAVLGGAPFNVAWHLQGFGLSPRLVTRVGADAQGRDALARMAAWGMDASCVQLDDELPTGAVTVDLASGEPRYTIEHPAAWDAIEPPPVAPAGVIVHGSLATRDPRSARALEELVARGRGARFVDVNLRAPWWERRRVLGLLPGAHTLKLSEDEVTALTGRASLDGARDLAERYELPRVVVTGGDKGAWWVEGGEVLRIEPPTTTEVVDTVGAGDAFMAVLVVGHLRGWPAEQTLHRAQAFASRVVGQRGATAALPSLYDRLQPAAP